MTSKEALKKVKNIGKEVNPSMYQVKELSRCCGVIKKDLEVLEILKNILDDNTLFRVFPYETAESFGDFIKSEEKVKEWLERKEKEDDKTD